MKDLTYTVTGLNAEQVESFMLARISERLEEQMRDKIEELVQERIDSFVNERLNETLNAIMTPILEKGWEETDRNGYGSSRNVTIQSKIKEYLNPRDSYNRSPVPNMIDKILGQIIKDEGEAVRKDFKNRAKELLDEGIIETVKAALKERL